MDIWRSFGGTVTVELTTADPERFFGDLTEQGVVLKEFRQTGIVTYVFSLSRADYIKAAALCEKRGEQQRIRNRHGLYWHIRKQLKRPVFYGSLLLLALVLWLPTRVLFFSVSGNESVTEKQILEAAEKCGVEFGASRKAVRSERVKNAMLERLPQLQWVGVNTSGCSAVISVREKQLPEEETMKHYPSGIVAGRDGYVLSCTARKGNLLVRPGMTVQKGHTLISGYSDCGLCIRAERAEGEILAQTNRHIICVMPRFRVRKEAAGRAKRKISLLLRKKRIFLWKDSGIWEGSCGRMYEEYYITLPGGFPLPVAVYVETLTFCDTLPRCVGEEDGKALLQGFSLSAVKADMVAGKILDTMQRFSSSPGLYRMEGSCDCVEMIGLRRQEQIGETNGENS